MQKKAGKPRSPIDLRPDRVLFPESGFTKHDAVDYYLAIADVLLPHLAGRPVSVKRFPGTVDEPSFWEKDAPSFTPEWVKTIEVPRRSGRSSIAYVSVEDRKTLAWVADVGGIEMHPFLHRKPKLDRPTAVVFDLDPGAGADILLCCAVALLLRDHLASLDLDSFAKLSGSKGVQVYVPLNTSVTHEETELFARTVADELARRHRESIVSKMAKSVRRQRVFIDWSQNADYKTTVAPYSLRGKRDRPLVSMPVSWDELESAARRRRPSALEFAPDEARKRIDRKGDPFAPVLRVKQKLPAPFLAALRKTRKSPTRRPSSEEEEGHLAHGIRLPRQGTQGGRRLFVLTRGELANELWLEWFGTFKRFILRPDRTGAGKLVAMPAGEFPAHPSYFRGEVQKEYRDTVTIEDLGAWELVEGSWESRDLDVFFTGRTLAGEWNLAKTSGKGHKSWRLVPVGGLNGSD